MKLIWQITERLTALVILLNIFDVSSNKLTDIIIIGQDSSKLRFKPETNSSKAYFDMKTSVGCIELMLKTPPSKALHILKNEL